MTHKDGQQHRASTNRAHSRRHVVIIVSVVFQWCGADLHSEGHGEQQGRREVRQTHTEGTPHEERAAARHAPYAAHHARHTLQSTAARTHTHTVLPQHQHTDGRGRSQQERHTRLHRMHIRRERSVVPHPSRRVRTHTRGGAAPTATEKQSNNKKRRSSHTTWIVGPREVQPIFITKTVQLPSAFVHIQRTPLHSGAGTTAAAAAHATTTRSKRGEVVWETVVLPSLVCVFVVSVVLAVTVVAFVSSSVPSEPLSWWLCGVAAVSGNGTFF
ncbi:hypothetical protein ECC02_007427 [Trypanosoma cruzi]|uniref:Uncharacterized protein n=1 Tax=Trypanosoma cruzi TaxID=5693 RepID=A0A7J6Y017_TRYCR|nr:hypothetical protein ECC02_007427 [Trypanosoma cruzi]